jgi:diacylglycerol kinase
MSTRYNTHSRNTQDNRKHYQEHTRQTTNTCRGHTRHSKYQRCLTTRNILRLVLFILGSWLVTDVDAFFLLTLASLNLMIVDEVDAVLLSR